MRGQLISLLISGTGIFATLLSSATPNANFPQFMNFLNYLLLSGYFLRRTCLLSATASHDPLATSSVSKALRQEEHKDEEEGNVSEAQESGGHDTETAGTIATANQTVHFGWYVLAAFLDVNGNFLFIKAYDYTSITSIMILDCFTIPSAMLLSYLFLSVRYSLTHLQGIVICVSGLVCIVVSDLRDSKSSAATGSSNQFLGDMMCILGSILYASSNVLQEHLVRKGLREEYMGNVGVCGIVMSGVQFIVLELPRMQDTPFSSQNVLAISGFVACLFFMYTNTSSFLEKSDAVLFNLSLLTSDVYAVVFSFFFYGHLVPWIYFLSYALVCIGLYIYYRVPPSSSNSGATINEAYNPLAGAGGSVQ